MVLCSKLKSKIVWIFVIVEGIVCRNNLYNAIEFDTGGGNVKCGRLLSLVFQFERLRFAVFRIRYDAGESHGSASLLYSSAAGCDA